MELKAIAPAANIWLNKQKAARYQGYVINQCPNKVLHNGLRSSRDKEIARPKPDNSPLVNG
jgi:hypothetical protein